MTEDSFEDFRNANPEATFTDWLREQSEPAWTDTVEHQFVRELGAGTIDDEVFRRYLVQDYAFVGTLAGLVGHAIGDAPTIPQKRRLGQFLSTLMSEENDYFERSFDALSVPESDRVEPEKHPVTQALEDLLKRATREGDYEERLAVLLPAEWCYLTWATSLKHEDFEAFYHGEWVELHAVDAFEEFVTWLRDELDRLGPELSPRRQRRIARHFRRTMELEAAFFEAAYDA